MLACGKCGQQPELVDHDNKEYIAHLIQKAHLNYIRVSFFGFIFPAAVLLPVLSISNLS